jgi:Flp pilus assembly pilin Flp
MIAEDRMTRLGCDSLPGRVVASAHRFVADNSGAAAGEYALLTFILIAIVAGVSQLGGAVTLRTTR